MTRLQAIQHYRRESVLTVSFLGNELLWGEPHRFSISIEEMKGTRYAIFTSNRRSYSCRKITAKQLLAFIRRNFPRNECKGRTHDR
jgi:hypothetical protein